MYAPKQFFKRFKKGITLVEVLVGMFVFTIMITSMIGVFVTLLQRRTEVRKMQQQTEEFSLAMSYMAKKMRMSDLAPSACSGSSCAILDHNENNTEVTFNFDAGTSTLKEGSNVLASNVTGGFTAQNTGVGKMPYITMRMMVPGKPDTSVQTTVSLRSY
jgi:Tfp pilus assembly protein PilW